MQAKALQSSADLVMFDLEDSVSIGEKGAARQQVITTLKGLPEHHPRLALRCNGLETAWFYRDVIEVLEVAVDQVSVLVIPKVENTGDVACFSRLLDGIERQTKAQQTVRLHACIESPAGLVQSEAIATTSSRLEALVFGIADYSRTIGSPLVSLSGHGENEELIYSGHRWHYVLSRLVTAAKSVGLQAIDAPYGNFRDTTGLEHSATQVRALGCDGKWAIHPDQLGVIRQVFSPTTAELELAQKVLEAAQKAEQLGLGAVAFDGRMIDQATVQLAKMALGTD
jgi:citrate lyase beta subunit